MGRTRYCYAMTLGTGPVWMLRKKAALVDAYSAHKHDPGSHIATHMGTNAVGHCSVSRLVGRGGSIDPSSNSNLSPSKPDQGNEPLSLAPCALPCRGGVLLHISTILAIVSFFRSLRPGHIWASLSAENISTRFCFLPHSCRPHAICKQACSALLTTCFLGFPRDLTHIYQKSSFFVPLSKSVSIADLLSGTPGFCKGSRKKGLRMTLKSLKSLNQTQFRLLDKARAGHLMRTQARELALEQEPSPQTWPCRR